MPDLLFGGGSGQPGAGGAPVNVPITAKAPAWAANSHDAYIPAGAPGQIGKLAEQMSMGGFGTGLPTSNSTNAAWLNSFYKPVPTRVIGPAPKAAPKVVPKPKVPPVGPTAAPVTNKRPSSLGHNAR